MKSSEQVFNNWRISNYHATVTGMHTSVFPFSLMLSLSLYYCVCFLFFTSVVLLNSFSFWKRNLQLFCTAFCHTMFFLNQWEVSIAGFYTLQCLPLVCIVEKCHFRRGHACKGWFQYIASYYVIFAIYIYYNNSHILIKEVPAIWEHGSIATIKFKWARNSWLTIRGCKQAQSLQHARLP